MGRARCALVMCAFLAAMLDARASAQSGERVVINHATMDDLYLTGETIDVRAAAFGDVVAAGRTIRVRAPVGGDAMLAGERIAVEAPVSDDVRAAGRFVRIAAPVAGHVVAAGSTVAIARGERVGDWAWLAGDQVDVLGSVGSLRAAGRNVTIRGEVRGDAEVAADTIRVAPGAVVAGDLRWSGEHEPIVEGATIGGRVLHVGAAPRSAAARVVGTLLWIGSVAIAVFLLFLVTPRTSAYVARTARTAKWKSLGAGLAVLLGVPFLIALSFLTGVLWIVGLVLLAAYLLALVSGALLGIVAMGELVLDLARHERIPSRRERAVAALLAGITAALLALVPVLGAIVLFVLCAVGIGATVISLSTVRRRAELEAPLAEPAPAT